MSNLWVTWGQVFNDSLQSLWWSFIQFTPRLFFAIVFFILGWVLGCLVAKAFENVFTALKVDSLFQSVGADNFFRKAGMNLNTGHFVGQVVKWFIIVVALMPSLRLVGLDDGSAQSPLGSFLRNDVLAFLSHVIVAVFILIIATWLFTKEQA